MRIRTLLMLIAAGCAGPRIDEAKLIDLTYSFNERSVYWPTARKFELTRAAHGFDDHGRWYAANEFTASEHGGTHLDAPIHFAPEGWASEEIPVTRFVGPARVIDISDRCAANVDYLLAPADIERHERRNGTIEPGTIVLIRTGFGERYPNLRSYLGSDVRGVAEDLHFPGIGAEGARLLVDRRIDLVGLDTASLDHGSSKDFIAHRILNEANIPGMENLANLDRLPAKGATIIALPMKIEGGTGGPCRVIAILP